jgi:hypothetical protein
MTDLERRSDRSPVPADWTYAPAPESTDIVRLQERYGLYVGGEWIEASEHYETVAPRDESPLAQVAQASPEDVRHAVGVAREAAAGWAALPGSAAQDAAASRATPTALRTSSAEACATCASGLSSRGATVT